MGSGRAIGDETFVKVETETGDRWLKGYIVEPEDGGVVSPGEAVVVEPSVALGLPVEEQVAKVVRGKLHGGSTEAPAEGSSGIPPTKWAVLQNSFGLETEQGRAWTSASGGDEENGAGQAEALKLRKRLEEQLEKRSTRSMPAVFKDEVFQDISDEDSDGEGAEAEDEPRRMVREVSGVWKAKLTGARSATPSPSEARQQPSSADPLERHEARAPAGTKEKAKEKPAGTPEPLELEELDEKTLHLIVVRDVMDEMKDRQVSLGEDGSWPSDRGEGSGAKRSVGRTMQEYQAFQEKTPKDPKRGSREYGKETREVAGVDAHEICTLSDFSTRIRWGQFKSFQTAGTGLTAIHDHLETGEHLATRAQTWQGARAVHQVTQGQGNWRNAWPATSSSDPGRREQSRQTAIDAAESRNMTEAMRNWEKRIAPRIGRQDGKDKERNDY